MPVTQADTACHHFQNDGVGTGNRICQDFYLGSLGKRSVDYCFHSNISLIFNDCLNELLFAAIDHSADLSFAGGRQDGLDIRIVEQKATGCFNIAFKNQHIVQKHLNTLTKFKRFMPQPKLGLERVFGFFLGDP